MERARPDPKHVTAWDLPTRVFHWTLVLCVASAWISYRFAEVMWPDDDPDRPAEGQ